MIKFMVGYCQSPQSSSFCSRGTVVLKEHMKGITTPETYKSLEFQYMMSAIPSGYHIVCDNIFPEQGEVLWTSL